ncbi:MAG: hypothetical protein JXM73_17540 [Anaerolineae bacterium]|nr:hypothetical protein [Anaerolineae bacterium]
MAQSRFWRIGLGLLILAIGLAAIGGAIQRNAWMQGYMLGQLSAGGEGQAVAPYMAYGYPGSHSVWPWVLGIGFIVALVMAFKAMRFHAWKNAGGQPPAEWAKHWHPHGMGPHWWHGEAPAAAEGEQAAPEQQPETKG